MTKLTKHKPIVKAHPAIGWWQRHLQAGRTIHAFQYSDVESLTKWIGDILCREDRQDDNVVEIVNSLIIDKNIGLGDYVVYTHGKFDVINETFFNKWYNIKIQ